MGSGGAARSSTKSNLISALYLLARFDLDFGHVKVQGQQSLPVVDHYAVPFKVQRASQQDGPRISRGDGCARWNRKVQSLMHALHLAVESTPRAEDIGNFRIDRSMKLSGPFPLGIGMVKDVLLDRLVLLYAFQLFLAWLGKAFRDADRNTRIFRSANHNVSGKRYFRSLGSCSLQ